ncbi:PAS-domain containing protein [Tranquillimonas alkanivorans]|uniref:PAS fold n=1 Tax=Tranquillimonas alkanivorans TaxID=441119 RepID=A0A1I5LM70_9RHOB|nr:PAS-domain containing protein [Tranquillimonas alkanivorans]SFO98227.1 PAS fold [Tranquillimonas alkanivorans]
MIESALQAVPVALAWTLAALLAGLVVAASVAAIRRDAGVAKAASAPDVSFLFHRGALIDATPAAQRLIDLAGRRGSDLDRLSRVLAIRFPDLHRQIGDVDAGTHEVVSVDGDSLAIIERRADRLRLTLTETSEGEERAPLDRHSLAALEDELETLREIARTTGHLLWRETARGEVVWVNQAYLEAAERHRPEEAQGWPLPRLLKADAPRARLSGSHGPGGWFDCERRDIGDGQLVCAVPADAAVAAEASLERLRQTMTRAFANVRTGIAVFDSHRRLTLFNPALVEITGLPAPFLAERPTSDAFFTALRDRKMVPEPRDFRTWLNRMTGTAETGDLAEKWHLPHGVTLRVTALPQEDGALTLLIDDITDDMTQMRRSRTALETGQAVLDRLDEAIAVFGPTGLLSTANAAYDTLWNAETSTQENPVRVQDAVDAWAAASIPTPAWDELRHTLDETGEREHFETTVQRVDGRPLMLRCTPLAGGSTLVVFSPVAAPRDVTPEAQDLVATEA